MGGHCDYSPHAPRNKATPLIKSTLVIKVQTKVGTSSWEVFYLSPFLTKLGKCENFYKNPVHTFSRKSVRYETKERRTDPNNRVDRKFLGAFPKL